MVALSVLPLLMLGNYSLTFLSQPPPRTHISFINGSATNRTCDAFSHSIGIYHSAEDWLRITLSITSLFERSVKGLYYPSSGSWLTDATSVSLKLLAVSTDEDAAGKLAAHFRTMLREMGPRDRILHLAHSGGAVVTYLCAKHHLTRAERERIDVTTFGGGRSITRKYFPGRVVNYYAYNDPLVMIDRRAGLLSRSSPRNGSVLFSETADAKHLTSFVFMEGRAHNPILDHSIEGATYVGALVREAVLMHRREYLLAMDGAPYPVGWLRGLRKRTALVTGKHHFWRGALTDAREALHKAALRFALTPVL